MSSGLPDDGSQSEASTVSPSPEDDSRRPAAFDPSDPVQTVAWGGKLPSTRRMVLGGLAGTSIVLVSNFVGVTSLLLGLDGGRLAAILRLDVLFPVGGFKRCYDQRNGFEFLVPKDWLADQTLFRRAAARAERALDPPALRARRPRQDVSEPIAGFGPPGNRGDTNLSMIVAPILPGFRLEDMGSSEDAAARFLQTIAPPESNRTATLISASQFRSPDNVLYYRMEYTVRAPTFFRHNISVYAAATDTLFTFNAQCPEDTWKSLQGSLKTAADSFRITI